MHQHRRDRITVGSPQCAAEACRARPGNDVLAVGAGLGVDGQSRLLADRVGFGHASDLCLSGRLVMGDEAHDIGLADRLVEPEQLLATAIEVAASYGANPAPQLRMIKQLLSANAAEEDLTAIQRSEHQFLAECWRSPQHAEAVDAFLAKRPPVFTR